MGKRLLILTFFLVLSQITAVYSQITIGAVDAGPYTPGSSIAATFDTGTACFKPGNIFNLYLVRPDGTELPGIIGSYNGFYTTFVNGTIPYGTSGTGYRLRIKTTNPATTFTDSAPFEIKAGLIADPILSSNSTIDESPRTFGLCEADDNTSNEFEFTNESTTGNVVVTIKNTISPATAHTLTYTTTGSNSYQSFTAQKTHYTLLAKATMPDGSIGTKAYFLINNPVVTAFETSGGLTVCFPTGKFEYKVGENIKLNFPGNIYNIDWGDGSASSQYTYCDIVESSFNVSHLFTRSSCGQSYNSGNQTFYNAFAVNVGVISPFCGAIGRPLSSPARVITRPINSFENPRIACLGAVTFRNTSVAGQTPRPYSEGCDPSTMRYVWYVDGTEVSRSVDLTYNFTTTGIKTIRLESTVVGGTCQAEAFEETICIQIPPEPRFTLSRNKICLDPGTLAPANTSVLNNTCATSTPIYTWNVTGPALVDYLNGTNANSEHPQFKFNQIGRYSISLTLQTGIGTCRVTSADQEIVVDGDPIAELSLEAKICQKGPLTFGPNATITKTIISGSVDSPTPLPDTYTWEVLGPGAYNFVAPSNANTKYPTINFSDYGTYTVKLTFKNSCKTVTETQVINIYESPIPKITATVNPICNNATVSLTGVTGSVTTLPVIWDNGINSEGFSRPNALTTTYTPTAAERTAGKATLFFKVNTGLQEACAQVFDQITITILSENTVSNPEHSKSICTGTAVNFIPTSEHADSFSWTATNPDGFIRNLVTTGTGAINQTLTNTNANDEATVVYTIIPHKGDCDGEPFILTVKVTPKPILTATATNTTICSNTAAGITLSSNLAGTLYTWTYTPNADINGATEQLTPISTSISDILVNSGSTNQNITYTITPILPNGCAGTPKTVTITVVPTITVAKAGQDKELCGATTYTLEGNEPIIGTGKWTVLPIGPTITDETKFNTTVTGLSPGTDYIFTWTITGENGCSTTDNVEVKVLNIIQNIIQAPTTTTVCYGQQVTINGVLPTGGKAPYTYKWEISTDNLATWSLIPLATSQNLTYPILENTSFRRVVNGGACESISTAVNIIALPPIDGNTIQNDQAICPGTAALPITGSQPTGGDGSNYTYQWELSTDNGASWIIIQNANQANYSPGFLTQKTQYRRKVSSGICSGASAHTSNVVTISMKRDAIAEFTTKALTGCVPFTIDNQNIEVVQHPGNATYTWYVNDVVYSTGINFPAYTIQNDDESVVIKLEVTSIDGCKGDEQTATFSTRQNVAASFTQDKTEGCGSVSVRFSNTSTSLTNATFKWDFGNGTSSPDPNPPIVTYLPDPSGKDTTYTVTLTASTPCGETTITSTVLVRSAPRPIFSPSTTNGCSPLPVIFTNNSPLQSGVKYYFDFGDGSPIKETTDRSDVSHTYTTAANQQQFNATLTAVSDHCGTAITEPYIIVVKPNTVVAELVVNGNKLRGCAPYTVTFDNNSTGATDFIVDFKDGTTPRQSFVFPERFTHTFTSPGTYEVTLTATNGCSISTTTETITVLPQPLTAFEADQTLGCSGLVVKFKNNTQNGISYVWDFGDGSPTSTDVEPTHTYTGDQEFYTVTLTATNNLSCEMSVSKTNLIHIVKPPVAAFNVSPSTLINIPNYTFRFADESTNNPTIWEWDFGDGMSSALKNPSHTYLDTGTYRVTLKVMNQHDCFTSTFKDVTIKGVPGYLFVPNSFIPGSTQPELRRFSAKGSGIQTWRFSIFNKWGQILWETTNLEEGRPGEGWDGTFKGEPMPQGVYYWKIDVQMVNGSEWKGMTYDNSAPKRTGAIHLIR